MEGPIIFNGFVFGILIVSFIFSKKKTFDSIKLGYKSFLKILPSILIVILILIFTQAIFSKANLQTFSKNITGPLSYLFAASFGSLIHIPFFIAFPIGGELLKNNINPGFIAVLITSLVMVHIFSVPIEVKELGWRRTIIRNLLCFFFSIFIGFFIGVFI